MTDRTCAVCGKTPTDGAASIITGDEKQWYCHDDEQVTCYMRAVMGTTADALESVIRERDALQAEVGRLRLVHAGQARLAHAALLIAEVDDDESTRAWMAEYDHHHAVKVLRDAAGRIDASDAVRWLRAEAARLEQQNASHNEQEQR